MDTFNKRSNDGFTYTYVSYEYSDLQKKKLYT